MQTIYKPQKVSKNYEVIVIGSGIGGLSTASILAQKKRSVLVLEQHKKAGGACHTFDHNGYRFATGIHYLGGMGESSPLTNEENGFGLNLRDVMSSLVPDGAGLEWDKMPEPFETVVFGDEPFTRHEIYSDEGRNKQELKRRFPEESEAIDEYYRLVQTACKAAQRAIALKYLSRPISRFLLRTGLLKYVDGGYSDLASITVQEGLDRLTKNQELKTILGYNWGCYGCEPKRASFIMQLLTTAVFLNGGYYPRGGPAEIPKKIVQNIRQHEGDVMVNARVKQILLEGSKAVGVEMQDGTVIRATEAVVSDVGFLHTTRDLLPPNTIRVNFCQNDRSQIPGQIHPGLTGFYLFVGLDKSPSDLNLPTSQHWLYPEFDTSACIDKIKGMPSLEAALDQLDKIDMTPIFVGNPGDKDSTWQQHHPNKTSLELLTLGPQWQWFEKYSGFDEANNTHGVDFETAKRRFADKMWARTVQVLNSFGAKLPLLLDDVAHFEIGSPLSFAHYYEASRGAFYGLDHDVNRFDPENFFLRLRPEVAEVPGLYLTGQDIVVDSLCGALLGGLLCAGKVLGAADPVALVKSLSVKTTRSKKRGLQIKPLPSFHVEDVYLSYPYDNM